MSHLNKHFDDSPESKKRHYQARLEAFQFNVETAIKNKLPMNVSEIREELVAIMTEDGTEKLILNEPMTIGLYEPREMTRMLKDTPYLALKDVLIFIPRGMKGTYMQTALGLKELADELTSVEEKVLTPLVNYTAGLLERPSDLERPFPYKRTVDSATIRDKLMSLYDFDSQKVQAPYGTVINRNKDWADIAIVNKEVQETMSPDNLERIIKKHDRVRELAKTLDLILKSNEADLEASAKTIGEFIDYVTYAADLLRHYGLVNSAAIAFNVALNDNIERLKEISN